ncbi:NUDIX domain-containing protein [Streptomyces violascens]|uniref:NUDIX domain-containing protein n=1 Tax=Streptomyces violascens TaxID=67381 RepID=UPI0037B9D965
MDSRRGHPQPGRQGLRPETRASPPALPRLLGHRRWPVEPGESLLDALAREVEEETGWCLRRVRKLLGVTTWTGDDDGRMRHEADYLVEVDGDLHRPRLESAKHTAYAWFGPQDLPRLKENRAAGEHLIHDLIATVLLDGSSRRPAPEHQPPHSQSPLLLRPTTATFRFGWTEARCGVPTGADPT